jgi:hypothetical protein
LEDAVEVVKKNVPRFIQTTKLAAAYLFRFIEEIINSYIQKVELDQVAAATGSNTQTFQKIGVTPQLIFYIYHTISYHVNSSSGI